MNAGLDQWLHAARIEAVAASMTRLLLAGVPDELEGVTSVAVRATFVSGGEISIEGEFLDAIGQAVAGFGV